MRYGIKSVTMDDVSHELGISKKTLYQYFDNKDLLVRKVTANHFNCQKHDIDQIIAQSRTAIDELIGIANWMNRMSQHLNPSLLFDLRKYHPESWAVFHEHRNTHILNCILQNMHRGIREGLYRPDINVEVLSRIYIARVEMFLDNEIFPYDRFRPDQTFHVFMDYHIHGIATAKGIKYLEKLKPQKHVA